MPTDRDICGDVRYAPTTGLISEEYKGEVTGAFVKGDSISRCHNSTSGKTWSLGFDASAGEPTDNPTAGHTTEEVRPYNISFPFLIAY